MSVRGLRGDIADPNPDREGFPVGILRRFRLARLLVGHAGLMPEDGYGARFVQCREPLVVFGIRRQRLPVAALILADGPKLALDGGDLPVVTELLVAADARFVGCRRFVAAGRKEKTVAFSAMQTDASNSAALFKRSFATASHRFRASSNSGSACSEPPAVFNTRAQQETGNRQIVIGAPIRLLTRRPGVLEERLRAVKRFAEAPAVKLLLVPVQLRVEPRVILRRRPAPPRRRGPAPRAPVVAACRVLAAGCRAKWPDPSSPPHPPRPAPG